MFIIGAGTLRYGEIITVLDAAKGAGVEKVGIVTEGMHRAAGATAGPLIPALFFRYSSETPLCYARAFCAPKLSIRSEGEKS